MFKNPKVWVAASCLLLIGFLAALWILTEYPYQSEYFSTDMQSKYSTPLKVYEAVQSGDPGLVSEAYGFDVVKKFGPRVQKNPLPKIETVQYTKNRKLALLDRQNHCCIWLRGRWVFYPENNHLMVYQLIWGPTLKG